MSSTIVIILVVIAVLILSLIAFLIIRRQRYVRALRVRGWTFESRPSLEWSLITTLRPSASASYARWTRLFPAKHVVECRSGCSSTRAPMAGHGLMIAWRACNCRCRCRISSFRQLSGTRR